MAKDISVVFSLKDNFSNALKGISKQQKEFKRDLESMDKAIRPLYDKKRQLQLDNRAATKALKDTMKQADKLGEAYQQVLYQKAKRKAEITLQMEALNKQIRDAEKNVKSFGKQNVKPKVDIDDKATSKINGISDRLKGLAKWGAVGLGAAAVGAGAGVVGIAKYSLGLASGMEQTNIAFETMLGGKAKADKFINNLKSFAIQTPFEFNQLTDSSKKMLAYGFKEADIIPTLTAVGNASSGLGLGADGVDRITIALGQMLAKTKVSADEMRQLTEAGVPAWELLAKATHTTTAELMKLAEKGAVPADKAVKALVKGMNQKFPDMMIKQSKSLAGLWSSMKDFANLNVFAAFGDGIRQGIQPALSKFVDQLTNSKGGLDSVQKKLTDVGRTMGEWFSNKAEGVEKYFERLFGDKAFQNADLGGKVKIVLDDMTNSMESWYEATGEKKVQSFFSNLAQGAVQILIDTLSNEKNIEKFAGFGVRVGNSITSGIIGGIDKKIPLYEDRSKYGATLSNATGALSKVSPKGWFDTLTSGNPYVKGVEGAYNIYKFIWDKAKPKAMGINRVPYDNYPAMLHEGETVLTKQQTNSRSNGSISIVINGLTVREEADIDKIADKLYLKLQKARMAYGGAH